MNSSILRYLNSNKNAVTIRVLVEKIKTLGKRRGVGTMHFIMSSEQKLGEFVYWRQALARFANIF